MMNDERPHDWKDIASTFASITNVDVQEAVGFLANNGWNLERAVTLFLDEGPGSSPPPLIDGEPGSREIVVYDPDTNQRRYGPELPPEIQKVNCAYCGIRTDSRDDPPICWDPECRRKQEAYFAWQNERNRNLVLIPNPMRESPLPSKTSFRIAQYNILGGSLGTSEHFVYVQPESLQWERRRFVLLHNIQCVQSDIICLEELDNYWTFFKYEMERTGYDSVYVKRPSLHQTSWSGKDKNDGCGIFWNRNRFTVIEERSINYEDDTDRVALLILLRDNIAEQLLLVALTHLYWDSTKPQIQLKQLRELELAIATFRKTVGHRYRQLDLPTVICGDFNNGPGSDIYRYVTHSFLQDQRVFLRSAYDTYAKIIKINPKEDVDEYENFWRNCATLWRNGKVYSDEYFPIVEGNYEPNYTTYNYKRKWTIDYIFYSCNLLQATHLLQIPPEEELTSENGPEGWVAQENQRRRKKRCAENSASSSSKEEELNERANNNGIPNSKYGSDHVLILSVFDYL